MKRTFLMIAFASLAISHIVKPTIKVTKKGNMY